MGNPKNKHNMIINLQGKIGSGKDTLGQIIQHLIAWKKTPIKENYIDDVLLSLQSNINNSNNGWEIKKFADKLKDIVCLLIGCTREDIENREFRDKPLGEEWNKLRVIYSDGYNEVKEIFSFDFDVSTLLDAKGRKAYIHSKEVIKLTPRSLLQLLGTEAGRNIIHPDIWVNSLFSEYKPNCNWIITDNRFPNETKSVKKEGGITIKIERDFNLRHPGYNSLEEVKQQNIELYKQLTHYSETALDDYNEWDHIIQNNGTIEELIEQVRLILVKENII